MKPRSQGKPVALKRLEGNPGQRKLPSGHVEPVGAAEPPDHLTGYALEVWGRVVRSMPAGVYLATDTETMVAYCDAVDTLHKAMQAIADEGHVLETPYGPKRNPWNTIATQTRAQIATLGARLGLDPLARESVAAPGNTAQSKFSGLAAIGGGKKA